MNQAREESIHEQKPTNKHQLLQSLVLAQRLGNGTCSFGIDVGLCDVKHDLRDEILTFVGQHTAQVQILQSGIHFESVGQHARAIVTN